MPKPVKLLVHIKALLAEMDLRYQQRYDAQTRALEAALLAAEKAVQTALTAAEKAVIKAETAAERRFESVNEFRSQLSDQAATFMPRLETEQRLNQSEKVIADLRTDISSIRQEIALALGKTTGAGSSWSMMIAISGILITLIGVTVAVIVASN